MWPHLCWVEKKGCLLLAIPCLMQPRVPFIFFTAMTHCWTAPAQDHILVIVEVYEAPVSPFLQPDEIHVRWPSGVSGVSATLPRLCVPLQRSHSALWSNLFMKGLNRTGPSIDISGTLVATGLQIQFIHGRQKSISRQPAPLHIGHVLPDQHGGGGILPSMTE